MTFVNKTMDRSDLFTYDAIQVTKEINNLITVLNSKDLHMSSWFGTLPGEVDRELRQDELKNVMKIAKLIGINNLNGMETRGKEYEPIEGFIDEINYPWYLYWEIIWVLKNGPKLNHEMKILDAGGTSSLFSCYLASKGFDIYSVEICNKLVENGNKIAKKMGWNMIALNMDMQKLEFEDEYFDHAYSICVFEHLEYEAKQKAINEIARCIKPKGTLSITFDYKNPAPFIMECGMDNREINKISSQEDIVRGFLSNDQFELVGNQEFFDNGLKYLTNIKFGEKYTFGSIFLRKRG